MSPPRLLKHLKILCCVPTLVKHLTRYPQMKCAVSPPPLFVKHLRILCSVPTLVWASDQMPQDGICNVPRTLFSNILLVQSTCISQCGTPSSTCCWVLVLLSMNCTKVKLSHILQPNHDRWGQIKLLHSEGLTRHHTGLSFQISILQTKKFLSP